MIRYRCVAARKAEGFNVTDACEAAGVVIYVTSHTRSYDPAVGRDRRNLQEDAVDSEYESSKTSDRVRRAMAANAPGVAPALAPAVRLGAAIGECQMKEDRDKNFVAKNRDGVTVNRWLSTGFFATSAAGTVENVRVMRDMATGRARGFGFVQMATDAEQRYVRNRPQNFAGRWAAKEAVSKVLGLGVRGVGWRDIEIQRKVDMATVQQNIGQLQGTTGAELRQQRELYNQLINRAGLAR